MGPSLGRLGDFAGRRACDQMIWPQWGRASEGSETQLGEVGLACLDCRAAMGPSLGRLGDALGQCQAEPADLPQWGRASEGSETGLLRGGEVDL